MSKRPTRLILYLLISLLAGIAITLAMDSFENIAVKKRMQKELEQEIRGAAISFKSFADNPTPKEVVNFIQYFSGSALNRKVLTNNPSLDKKPDSLKYSFLFSFKDGEERLDFYLINSYLEKEITVMAHQAIVFGLIMAIVVFTCIILYVMYWERRIQDRALYQKYEVKQAEFIKYLEEHEALALLGRMVASLAHELKTPIATISNLVQVLPDRTRDEKFINRFVALTGEELSRIQQLINNLLAYGKDIEVKDEEWLDFPTFLQEIAVKNSLQIEVPPLVEIYGDKFLLNLLFNNLLRNSKKEHAEMVHVKIRINTPEDSSSEILLEDDGNGFTSGVDLNTLLRPFVTCHSSGAGLGLYLAKQVVTAHDGNISLYRLEHGAGVNVTLPRKRVKQHDQT